MALSGITMFWIILAAIFGPVVVVAYILSIIKAVRDRQRIRLKNEAIRLHKLHGQPVTPILPPKKPNIQVVEDTARALKWKLGTSSGRSPARQSVFSSRSSPIDKDVSVDRCENNSSTSVYDELDQDDTAHTKNGTHNVRVTVEHNPKANGLAVHGSRGRQGKKQFHSSAGGIDNLGSSFSDISKIDTHIATIEMDNLGSESGGNRVNRAPSDASSWNANSDVDIVTDSEAADLQVKDSPDPIPGSATRLLPNSQVHRQSSGKHHHVYQQHQRRPQKPKRGVKGHIYTYNNEKGSLNGSLRSFDDAEESLAHLNGVRVLVTSQSHEKDLNLVSHYTRSNRRNSYAAAIDADYDLDDASPSRSLSDDNLHCLSYTTSSNRTLSPYSGQTHHGGTGNINRGFARSREEPFVEM